MKVIYRALFWKKSSVTQETFYKKESSIWNERQFYYAANGGFLFQGIDAESEGEKRIYCCIAEKASGGDSGDDIIANHFKERNRE